MYSTSSLLFSFLCSLVAAILLSGPMQAAVPVQTNQKDIFMDDSATECGTEKILKKYPLYSNTNYTVKGYNPTAYFPHTNSTRNMAPQDCYLVFYSDPATPNSRVKIQFGSLQLECGMSLTFYNGLGITPDILSTLTCDSKTGNFLSSSGGNLTVFLNRGVKTAFDFKLYITSYNDTSVSPALLPPFYMDNYEKECGSIITVSDTDRQVVQAWGYDTRTNSWFVKSCKLFFKSAYENGKLRVHFIHLNLPENEYSTLTLYDANGETNEIVTYANTEGTIYPNDTETTQQYLTILFYRGKSTSHDFRFIVTDIRNVLKYTTHSKSLETDIFYMSRYDHCTTVNKVELNSREIIKVWPSETRPEELTIPKSCYITYMASTPDRTLRISVQNINLPCGQQAELTFYDSKHFETVLRKLSCTTEKIEDFETSQQYVTIRLERAANLVDHDFTIVVTEIGAESKVDGLGAGAIAGIVIALVLVVVIFCTATILGMKYLQPAGADQQRMTGGEPAATPTGTDNPGFSEDFSDIQTVANGNSHLPKPIPRTHQDTSV